MTDVKVGDKARVTYEGVVNQTDEWGCFTLHDEATFPRSLSYRKLTYGVEVIEKAKPKVGDKVSGEAAYHDLPVGSILVSKDKPGNLADMVIVSGEGRFRDGYGHAVYPCCERTLISIPES